MTGRFAFFLLTIGRSHCGLRPRPRRGVAPIVLPDTVTPIHYDIELTPHPAAATFTAVVHISVFLAQPTPDIKLNAARSHLLAGAAFRRSFGAQDPLRRETANREAALPHAYEGRLAHSVNRLLGPGSTPTLPACSIWTTMPARAASARCTRSWRIRMHAASFPAGMNQTGKLPSR